MPRLVVLFVVLFALAPAVDGVFLRAVEFAEVTRFVVVCWRTSFASFKPLTGGISTFFVTAVFRFGVTLSVGFDGFTDFAVLEGVFV